MTAVHVLHTSDDGSLPVKTDKEKREMLNQRREVELHSYYEYIKQYTYKTSFVSISIDEAEALRRYFRSLDGRIKLEKLFGEFKAKVENTLKKMNEKSEKSSENNDDSKEEKKEVESKGEKMKSQYFVRLSTRSPKDAVDKPIFKQKLLDLLKQEFGNDKNRYNDLNERLIGLRRCFSKVMCVSSVDEILTLLSFSNRCISDIRRLLEHKHLINKWELYLVIREYNYIPIKNEFRLFICDNKITAITQYYTNCYFKGLKDNKSLYYKFINNWFKTHKINELLLNKLNIKNCILDLNVSLDKFVKIIELNPFGKTTGSGFYDWTKDEELLYGRVKDVKIDDKIRVRSEVYKHVKAVLTEWKFIFEEFEKINNIGVSPKDKGNSSSGNTSKKLCVVL